MTEKQQPSRKKKIFIFTILSAILLAIWLISEQEKSSSPIQSNSENIGKSSEQKEKQEAKSPPSFKIEQRLSLGEKILIGADNSPDKQLGVQNFAKGNFSEAQIKFANSLKSNPNDPEALIYLNNALAAQGTKPITIGVSVPIGGSLDVSKEILRGVAQAQNEINQQGGIGQNGAKHLLKVQIANDDNQPETAQKIAINLVGNPEILGVIGHNASDASITAASIYQKGSLVMITPTSTSREISQLGSYIFRTTPSSKVLAETMAQHTVDIRRQKVAVCVDSSSSASVSFKEDFSLSLFELGGEITPTNCDFASENFNSDEIPSKAIADGAEALLLAPSVDKINQAIEVAKANENRLTLLGNDSMYTYETLKVGQSDINGLVLPAAWHPSATDNSTYNKNAIKLWGMAGSWRTATSYDAVKALISALSTSTTRQGVQQALANSGFVAEGASGKVTFWGSGDRQIKKTFLVKVKPGKSSGTGYDFFSLD